MSEECLVSQNGVVGKRSQVRAAIPRIEPSEGTQ